MKDLPVYLFAGFAGAGKTQFISEILADADFCTGENVLLLICEGNKEGYNTKLFLKDNVTLYCIKAEQELTPDLLSRLENECAPERVLIEYNGAWQLPTIYSAMPKHWFIYQNLCIANSEGFAAMAAAMQRLCFDKLQDADVVMFNRCTNATDKALLQRLVRRVNDSGDIMFEDVSGNITKAEAHEAQAFGKNGGIKPTENEYDIFLKG